MPIVYGPSLVPPKRYKHLAALCYRCHQVRVSGAVCDGCRKNAPRGPKRPMAGRPLTTREKAVCELVAQAKSNKVIGFELSLTEGTVKEYVHRIFEKTGVANRVELALRTLAGRPGLDYYAGA